MHSSQNTVTPQNLQRRVWLYMFIIVIIWGLTATVEAVTLKSLYPLQFSFWSTVSGSLGVLAWTILNGTSKKLLSFSVSDHGKLFILAMFGFAGYFFLKYTAYSISPIPQANVLQYTFTIFIVIFAVPLLKQPLSIEKIAGVLVGFAGTAVVITGGKVFGLNTAHLPGYLLALGAGVSFALFSVLFEKTSFERLYALFYFHCYSALILFFVLILRGEFVVPTGITEIGGAIYSGFISNVAGMYLWLAAQNVSDDVSLLTGILYFIPFVSLLCFKLFLNLPIPLYAYAGLSLIVGGMAIHTLRTRNT